jgi:hypothetical protein
MSLKPSTFSLPTPRFLLERLFGLAAELLAHAHFYFFPFQSASLSLIADFVRQGVTPAVSNLFEIEDIFVEGNRFADDPLQSAP